ncbi:conserved hypothetical protein [Vibrio chagasii]|nr:conserved hypothetical protein [Vibrio chagasii]
MSISVTKDKQANQELVKEADALLKSSGLYLCLCCETEEQGSCTLGSYSSTQNMIETLEQLKVDKLESSLFGESFVDSDTEETVNIFIDIEDGDCTPSKSERLEEILTELGVEEFSIEPLTA